MADWTPPPYPQLVAGKPWTDEKALAAFENVEALAEGAVGAPKVQGVALGNTFRGWQDFSSGSPAVFLSLDRVKDIHCVARTRQTSGGSSNLRVEFSANNGASWGAAQNLYSTGNAIIGGTDDTYGDIYIDLSTGAWVSSRVNLEDQGASVPSVSAQSSNGTLTVPAACNALRFSSNVSGVSGRIILSVMSGVSP